MSKIVLKYWKTQNPIANNIDGKISISIIHVYIFWAFLAMQFFSFKLPIPEDIENQFIY